MRRTQARAGRSRPGPPARRGGVQRRRDHRLRRSGTRQPPARPLTSGRLPGHRRGADRLVRRGGVRHLLPAARRPSHTIRHAKKRVSGPLVAGGQDTGVKLEIRFGGPAIGFQQVSAQMYADKTITLGLVSTDEAIQNSAELADASPCSHRSRSARIMIMWDTDKHPDFNTIADLGQTDTTVALLPDRHLHAVPARRRAAPARARSTAATTAARRAGSPRDGDIAQGGLRHLRAVHLQRTSW